MYFCALGCSRLRGKGQYEGLKKFTHGCCVASKILLLFCKKAAKLLKLA
jgi:hypothetical protein